MKYVLIFSDGESIEAETCETRKEAHEKMVKSYEEYYPEDQNETWADMSYLGEESALLYLNGDGTCCWSIYAITTRLPESSRELRRNNMSKILCHIEFDISDVNLYIVKNIELESCVNPESNLERLFAKFRCKCKPDDPGLSEFYYPGNENAFLTYILDIFEEKGENYGI